MLRDPEKQREPGATSPAPTNTDPDKGINDRSVVPASHVVADQWATSGLDRHRRQVDHQLEQLDLCGWCTSFPVLPGTDRCLGCAEIGAGDVFSPRAVTR